MRDRPAAYHRLTAIGDANKSVAAANAHCAPTGRDPMIRSQAAGEVKGGEFRIHAIKYIFDGHREEQGCYTELRSR